MGQKVNLGGDRIGSGSKMETSLHCYHRSTHNLSYDWISSMCCGTLVPFMCLPILKGDTFDIELNAAARTVPSKGFLFGSFKVQMDVYSCPVRLYQAILHNNPTAIGLKMSQIKFPTLELNHNSNRNGENIKYRAGFLGDSSLVKYLGMSGIGQANTNGTYKRYVNAIPILAYYDIFKNYYANKQEENAYFIGKKTKTISTNAKRWSIEMYAVYPQGKGTIATEIDNNPAARGTSISYTIAVDEKIGIQYRIQFSGNLEAMFESRGIRYIVEIDPENSEDDTYTVTGTELLNAYKNGYKQIQSGNNVFGVEFIRNENNPDESQCFINLYVLYHNTTENPGNIGVSLQFSDTDLTVEDKGISLQKFPLKNLDDLRYKILSYHQFGNSFKITKAESASVAQWNTTDGETGSNGYPYTALAETIGTGQTANSLTNYGLCVKTYQSDIFNNWLDTELIDGENGIAEITKISVTDGAFKIDALNLGEKLYNMLNRVVASGNTLQDWENAVYTTQKKTFRHLESPIYLGGSSNEIVFDEIVQTTPTESGALGTIGGKGMLIKRKGGKIHVKAEEAAFIIGIVSITPRLVYSQGNEWYMTELQSYDDFHKPALDGIGYQNLIGERMAYWDTVLTNVGALNSRSVIGKLPAWIDYMTNYDKAYGEFANIEKTGYSVLARNYEADTSSTKAVIKDATTYIDPTKYNYAFAYTDLEAQNFWLQIRCKVIARRLMSAKQIPNL